MNKEIAIVRELAKKQYEIAMSDRHVAMRRRFQDTNDLKFVRPPLNVEEVPWHEMNFDHELDLQCQDPFLRDMERTLRRNLFREKYFRCDNHITPYWAVSKSYSTTGNGLEMAEQTLATDDRNHIISHSYMDVLEDESALEKFRPTKVTAHPEQDRENVARAQEILGDSMPVKLVGHTIYYAPWDRIVRLRGIDNVMIDIYDRPEYLHKIIGLFTEDMASYMDQMEALGLFDSEIKELHCTPGNVTVPNPSADGHHCQDIWFRTMAQAFSSISPSAHYEFDIQYSVPLAQRCAYTYYGCCEPLHDRIDILKHYKNLRKIGVSPWADLERSAEQIGKNYVLSRKPNPAHVAVPTDPEVIRREITETAQACLKYGCPCDITLKDISTVAYKPEALIAWTNIASDVLDQFYGKE